MEKKFKTATNHEEKIIYRSKMFNFLDNLENKYKIEIDINDIIINKPKPKSKKVYSNLYKENIKAYKHQYYLNNIEKYRERNKINNKIYRDRKKLEKEKENNL